MASGRVPTEKPRRFSVLMVCTANECRSVIGHEALEKTEAAVHLAVHSAGTEANEGSPRCEYTKLGAKNADHTSTHIESVELNNVDLILTMEKKHSSKIAQLAPSVRSKTFTLPQAVSLTSAVAQSLTEKSQEFDAQLPADWTSRTELSRLQWLVSEMNEARGYVHLDNEEIPDAHGNKAAEHGFVLPAVANAVGLFSGYVLEIVNFNKSK